MIIPIRCLTCGNILGSKYSAYLNYLETLSSDAKHNLITTDVSDLVNDTVECQALDKLGLTRYCCRRHFLTHNDIIDLL
jgi:DNA-directed RNA polymerase I, II, and III subunit RPABC5